MTEPRATYTTERRRVRPMTARQAALLRFIIRYKTDHGGDSPTVRQMTGGAGYASTSVTIFALESLARRGLITRRRGHIAVTGGRWVYEPPQEAV